MRFRSIMDFKVTNDRSFLPGERYMTFPLFLKC